MPSARGSPETPFAEYQELILTNGLDTSGTGTLTNFSNEISATALDNKVTHMCLTELAIIPRSELPDFPVVANKITITLGDATNVWPLTDIFRQEPAVTPTYLNYRAAAIERVLAKPTLYVGNMNICPGQNLAFDTLPFVFPWPDPNAIFHDATELNAALNSVSPAAVNTAFRNTLSNPYPATFQQTAAWSTAYQGLSSQSFDYNDPLVKTTYTPVSVDNLQVATQIGLYASPLIAAPTPNQNIVFAENGLLGAYNPHPFNTKVNGLFVMKLPSGTSAAKWDCSHNSTSVITATPALPPMQTYTIATMNNVKSNTSLTMTTLLSDPPKKSKRLRGTPYLQQPAKKQLFAQPGQPSVIVPSVNNMFQIIVPNLELSYLAAGQTVHILKTLISETLPSSTVPKVFTMTFSQLEWKPVSATLFNKVEIIIADASGEEHALLTTLNGLADVYVKIRFRNTPTFPVMGPYS